MKLDPIAIAYEKLLLDANSTQHLLERCEENVLVIERSHPALIKNIDESITDVFANVLMENRIQFLKDQYRDKIESEFDTFGKHKTSDAIVDFIAKKIDPTPNSIHTNWLINQYRKEGFHQEDSKDIKKTLSKFEEVKHVLPKKDINQYSDLGEIRDAIAPVIPFVASRAKEKAATKQPSGELEKIFDMNGVTGYKIPTKASSIANYGQGGKVASTNWCTAARSSNNAFDNYSSRGPLYSLHFPNGEVAQLHHAGSQLMKANNTAVSLRDEKFEPYTNEIREFVKHTSELDNQPTSSLLTKYGVPPTEEQKNSVIGHISGGALPKLVHNNMIKRVLSSYPFSDSDFATLLDSAKKHSTTWVSINPNLKSHHYEAIINSGVYRDSDLLSNHSIPIHLIDRVNASSSRKLDPELASRPDLRPDHIDAILKLESRLHHEINLGSNNAINISHEQQALFNNKEELVHRADLSPDIRKPLRSAKGIASVFLERPDVTQEEADELIPMAHVIPPQALNNKEIHIHPAELIRTRQMEHPRFTKSDITSYIDEANSIHASIFNNPNFNESHVKQLEEKHVSTPHEKICSMKLSPDTFYKNISRSLQSDQFEQIANSKNLTSDVVSKMITGDHPPLYKMHAIKLPAATAEHFKYLHKQSPMYHSLLSSSTRTPPSILSSLAKSPNPTVRRNIASNKNSSRDDLKLLSNDEHADIREIANRRLSK